MVTPRRHRRRERGAAVFIVVMVITLLTAIGVFSIRTATLVDQAAGFERQGLQTQYLTEYAGRAAATELGDGAARAYLDRIVAGTDQCQVNSAVTPLVSGTPVPCYKIFMTEIDQRVSANVGSSILEAQTASTAGSLGGPTAVTSSALAGAFVVEMTEPYESIPNPGSEQASNASSSFRDVQVTLTAFGQVRPVGAGGGDPWCAESAASTSASVSALRAHITLENVPR